jgi:hypothetical protein
VLRVCHQHSTKEIPMTVNTIEVRDSRIVLFWIICHVDKKLGIEVPLDVIGTNKDHAFDVGKHELWCQQQHPDCLHQFTFEMCQHVLSRCDAIGLLVLFHNVAWKLFHMVSQTQKNGITLYRLM